MYANGQPLALPLAVALISRFVLGFVNARSTMSERNGQLVRQNSMVTM